LSPGYVDVPMLLAEVTLARERATAMEAARVAAMLAIETSTYEVATVRNSTALHVKDAEDRAALAGTEAL
jgi:hypothetical protein